MRAIRIESSESTIAQSSSPMTAIVRFPPRITELCNSSQFAKMQMASFLSFMWEYNIVDEKTYNAVRGK